MEQEKQKRKYSDEETEQLELLYEEHGTEGVPIIAEELGRTVKSVIAKLVRMGLYVPMEKPKPKRGPSKKDLLNELESIVGFDMSGFANANKQALTLLLEFLSEE